MTNTPKNDRSTRRPDCVTEIRMGNSVLVVSGYFKQDTTATAADKMLKVLESPYGIVGLAVGNGGHYVKTDHPIKNLHYRPLFQKYITRGRTFLPLV